MSPIDAFFTQPFDVERFVGETPVGSTFDGKVSLLGRVKFENRMVRNENGDEVVSSGRISMSVDVPDIPVGSRVTVRGRRREVLAESRHIGGFDHSSDYYSIDLT